MESIIINHPFIDGNKRMGYAFMRLLLSEDGYDLKASKDAIFKSIVSISKGEINKKEIIVWIKNHI